MRWTYITDDPATLPPLDTPVFVMLDEDSAIMAERSNDPDGWLWSIAYDSPQYQMGKWVIDSMEFDDLDPLAWHPLPELPTEVQS